ncbi:MAG: hypothetical protein NDJ90_11450 [Oligoflexia bacterium]|nr:hypothetical protein [Oligoflexia bacterium]
MKNRIFAVAGLSAVLAIGGMSCKKIEGGLRLERDLPIKVKVPDPFGGEASDKIETIKAGSYEAKVDFRSQKEFILKVKVKRFRSEEIVFGVAEGHYLPDFNGTFALLSAESGQPFDLKAETVGNITRSSDERGYESCTFYEREYVCRMVKDQQGDGRHEECRWESVAHSGTQEVEYHYVYTTRDIAITLLDSATQDRLGGFDGHRTDSDKVYTYQGPCFGGHGHHPRPPRY